MKKRAVAAVLAALLLAGCSAFQSAEYLNVQEHVDPFSYKGTEETATEEPLTANSYYDLRSAITTMMTEGTEHAVIQVSRYSGNLDTDMRRVVDDMTQKDPVGAYAIDYINYEVTGDAGRAVVDVNLVYRRSAGEIASIRSVRGNEQADQLLFAALEEFAPSITLQISGYSDEDFEETIRSYCLYHPDKTTFCNNVSVAVYPQSGNVRVVEFHFSYEKSRDELRTIASDTATALSSAYNYMRYAETPKDRATLALSYLVGRFDYEPSDDATVYTLLCEGKANSTVVSSAFAFLCRSAEIPCYIIEGTKNQQPYTWVMIELDSTWYHIDIADAVFKENRVLTLKTDAEMTGFSWEHDLFPVCNGVPLAEPGEPAQE